MLTGGEVYSEGKVEICLNNEWESVCSDMWDATEVGVVCRQLGLPASGMYVLMCVCMDGRAGNSCPATPAI